VRFAANVDPKDLARALDGADPDSTLVVVVSKTFTTQETMANAQAAKAWGARNFIAVTANVALARQFGVQEIFPCGTGSAAAFRSGRRSASPAMCAIGPGCVPGIPRMEASEVGRALRAGARSRRTSRPDGLVGAWNTNFLGLPTHAVLPYSSALRLLPSYLQQLEMESNGKRVDREGRQARLCHGAGAVRCRGHR
jgi:glucose-6-phosphate isomerase